MIPNSWTTVLHGDESCDEERKIICNIQNGRSSMVSPDIIHSSSFADSDLKVPQIPIGAKVPDSGAGQRSGLQPYIRACSRRQARLLYAISRIDKVSIQPSLQGHLVPKITSTKNYIKLRTLEKHCIN
jgi:hypothetical protein